MATFPISVLGAPLTVPKLDRRKKAPMFVWRCRAPMRITRHSFLRPLTRFDVKKGQEARGGRGGRGRVDHQRYARPASPSLRSLLTTSPSHPSAQYCGRGQEGHALAPLRPLWSRSRRRHVGRVRSRHVDLQQAALQNQDAQEDRQPAMEPRVQLVRSIRTSSVSSSPPLRLIDLLLFIIYCLLVLCRSRAGKLW